MTQPPIPVSAPPLSERLAPPLSERLAALVEPVRIRILHVLSREELAVGELSRVLQTPQPSVSRHLKLLHGGGWLQQRRAGTAALYRLDAAALAPGLTPIWSVVAAEIAREAADPVSLHAEDLRRLDGVLSQRTGDSEELFRRLGGRWDEVRRELFGDAVTPWLLSALLPEGAVIADLGCGTGSLLPLLALQAGTVIGIDREAAMLEVAAARISGLANVTLLTGLLDALPLGRRTVDLAISALVLHHIQDLQPVAAEVARVLAPGGRWIILDMVEHDREDYRVTMGHRHSGFSERTIQELAASVRLRMRSWRVLPPDPEAQGPGLFVAVMD